LAVFSKKYILFERLTTTTQKFSVTKQLLAGEALSQWRTIKAKLVVETKEIYD